MNKESEIIRLKTRPHHLHPVLMLTFVSLFACISWANPAAGTNNAKNVSVLRDPFWPVGYQPASMPGSVEKDVEKTLTAASGSTDWKAAMKQVVINGVSSRSGNEYVAVINNEVKTVGESISVFYDGVRYTWTVQSITPPKSVQLRRVSAR